MYEGFRYFSRLVRFAESPLGAVPVWLPIGALLLTCVAGWGGIRAAIVLVPSNIKPPAGYSQRQAMRGCPHYTVQQCSGTDRLDVPVIPGLVVWWATAFGLGLAGVRFIAARCTLQRVPISIKSAVMVSALAGVGTTGT